MAFEKEDRARDGAKAMMEYEAETLMVRERLLGAMLWGRVFGVLVFEALMAIPVVGV